MLENEKYSRPPKAKFKSSKYTKKWEKTEKKYKCIPERYRIWGPTSLRFVYLCSPKVLIYNKYTDDSTSIYEEIYANDRLVGRWARYNRIIIPHKYMYYMYVFDNKELSWKDSTIKEAIECFFKPQLKQIGSTKIFYPWIDKELGITINYVKELKMVGRVLPETGEWLVQTSGEQLIGLEQKRFEYQCERMLTLIRKYICETTKQVWINGKTPADMTVKVDCRKCGENNFIVKINKNGLKIKKCKSCKYSERLFMPPKMGGEIETRPERDPKKPY